MLALAEWTNQPYFQGVAGRKREAPTAFDSSEPPRNFTLDVNDRMRALTIGAPAFATRKKRIEDMGDAHVDKLVDLHEKLTEKGHAAEAIRARLVDTANALDLKRMNELVAIHNRYYPMEANLPMNLRGHYMIYGRPWHPEPPWTPERIVELALAAIAENED